MRLFIIVVLFPIKLHFLQERTREFQERLRDDPSNEDLWVEFVDFQDVSLGDSVFGGEEEEEKDRKREKKNAARNVVQKQKALVEKKLAILKTALDKNPKSIKLSVKRLHLSR